MKLIPPTESDHLVSEKKFHNIDHAITLINDYTQSIELLFNREVTTHWNFGAPIVWARKYNQAMVAGKIFFPDVGIFSSKVKLFDIFRQRYFATYSDFHHHVAKNKLKAYFLSYTVKLLKLEHPYSCATSINLNNSATQHLGKSCLLFLPKSTPVTDRLWNVEDIRAGLEKCLKYSERVSLCVYYQDIPKLSQLNVDWQNIDVVSAGSRYDALFYFRLKFLIENHKFVAYFEPGSHSIFASFSNKKHLFLNCQIKAIYKSQYQVGRYPTKNDLHFFNKVCGDYLRENNLVLVEQLKAFLSYSLNYENRRFVVNNFSPRYMIYKLIKRIIFFIDNLKKSNDKN